MLLYYDLDASAFVTGAGTRDLLTTLSLKRGDTCSLAVQFVRAAVAQELATGASGILGVKAAGDYDGDFIAAAASWTKTGTGTATLYTFDLNLATTEINALLSGDTASVAALMEMEFLVGSVRTSSQTLTITISNDVIKGDESGPVAMATGIPVHDATITVTGTLSDGSAAVTFPVLLLSGTMEGKNTYSHDGSGQTGTGTEYYCYYDGTYWILIKDVGAVTTANWVSASSSASTPDNADWSPSAQGSATGVPVVVRGATPGRLGSLSVSEGFLYVVDSIDGDSQPVWKKIALDAL